MIKKKLFQLLILTASPLVLASCAPLDAATKYTGRIYKEFTKSSNNALSNEQHENESDNELYVGIIYNNIPLIEKAIRDGADTNKMHASLAPDSYGQNPLLLAYHVSADDDIIETLKNLGAKMDHNAIKDSDWWTAASNAYYNILDEMINGGFDMDTKNVMQMTAYSAAVTGNNTDYDISRSLDVLHQHGYKPTEMDLKLCKYNNDGFTHSYQVKTIKCIAEKLKSMHKENWLGKQLTDECTEGDIKKYRDFYPTDIHCLAAFGDRASLEYAMGHATDDYNLALLTSTAIRCNNIENYRYLKSLGITPYTDNTMSQYENSVYECIASGYDGMLAELADDIPPGHARLALAVSQHLNDENYFASYIKNHGFSETDQNSLILQVNTAEEARWLPIAIKYGYTIRNLPGRSVKAPGTFAYLDCGGSKTEALEGCWDCRECYGDVEFLEKLSDTYHVNLEDKLPHMLELAVGSGYVESAKWLLGHGAKTSSHTMEDTEYAPYFFYNSDEMLSLIKENFASIYINGD